MLFELFPRSSFAPVLATFLWAALIGLCAWLAVFKTPVFNVFHEFALNNALTGMLNTCFVFFIAFMAADSFQGYNNARNLLINENNSVNRLLATPLDSPVVSKRIHEQVVKYLQNVTDNEWGRNFNKSADPSVDDALNDLTIIVNDPRARCLETQKNSCTDTAAASNILRQLDELRQARDSRLAIGARGGDPFRYYLSMFMALNAAISLVLLMIRNRRAATIALTMYCTSLWVIFMIVILHSNPYVGLKAIQPDPLEKTLKSLQREANDAGQSAHRLFR